MWLTHLAERNASRRYLLLSAYSAKKENYMERKCFNFIRLQVVACFSRVKQTMQQEQISTLTWFVLAFTSVNADTVFLEVSRIAYTSWITFLFTRSNASRVFASFCAAAGEDVEIRVLLGSTCRDSFFNYKKREIKKITGYKTYNECTSICSVKL